MVFRKTRNTKERKKDIQFYLSLIFLASYTKYFVTLYFLYVLFFHKKIFLRNILFSQKKQNNNKFRFLKKTYFIVATISISPEVPAGRAPISHEIRGESSMHPLGTLIIFISLVSYVSLIRTAE